MTPSRGDDGFTLVELLVTMLIIGVLSAIAIPAFANQRSKAHVSAARSDLHNAAIAAEAYFVENDSFPTAWVDGEEPTTPAAGTGYYRRSANVSLIAVSGAGTSYCLQVTDGAGQTLSWTHLVGLQPVGTHCPGL